MDGEGGLEGHFAADTTLLVRCVFARLMMHTLGTCLGNSGFCWRKEDELDSRLA